MVEKFNFYDIYGYLLPGIALCGLVWLPFGLLFHLWPSVEVSSALLALVLAYLVGHLIHVFAMDWLFPLTDSGRYPSDSMMDKKDKRFTAEIKNRIDELSRKYFGLPLFDFTDDVSDSKLDEIKQDLTRRQTELKALDKNIDRNHGEIQTALDRQNMAQLFHLQTIAEALEEERARLSSRIGEIETVLARESEIRSKNEQLKKDEQELAKITDEDGKKQKQAQMDATKAAIKGGIVSAYRTDAFFQARSALLRTGRGFYWEQYQGLYALMCGLSATTAISAPYFLGWAAGVCRKKSDSIFLRDVDVGAIIALGLLLIYLATLALRTVTVRASGTQKQQTRLRWSTRRALLLIALLAGYFLRLAAQPPPPEPVRPCASSLISITACGGDAKEKSENKFVVQITHPAVLMFLLALGALVVAISTHQAFRSFARTFAEHVWRDFANIEGRWMAKSKASALES